MKRFIAALLIVLSLTSPVYAQDATEEPPVVVAPEGDVVVVDDSPAEDSVPTSYLVLGLIGLFVFGVGFWARSNNIALENATQSIPLPIVEALFDLAYNATQRTVDPIDDDALLAGARKLGYTVEANARGGYDLSRPS